MAVATNLSYDEHLDESRETQRRADRWMIAGCILMGTLILGIIGLPMFLIGVFILKSGLDRGLSVRPLIVTLIGYLVLVDAALNTLGWALDLIAHHTLLNRVATVAWGNFFDAGYFWRYNELWIGGSGAPGEKSWEIGCVSTMFSMRVAAAIGFLQMKRWGHQWMIVTCWMGVLAWTGYLANMTIYADLRYTNVGFPVVAWWIYDIFYITPFISLPYLHTVNRELFTD